ncbi:hypothetical protein [Simkania negevensis]|nr:hypothetical protein [Simkania negevensis]MCB1073985.1 hypothetical protein [Simkania sp.]
MKRRTRMTWLIFLGLMVAAGAERSFYYLKDGFSPKSITSKLPSHPHWNTAISEEDKTLALEILSQDFHYLGSGSQSFVFTTSDERFVIKFFKHKRWQLNPIYEYLPLPAKLEAKKKRWKEKKLGTVNNTFLSCKASYELFKRDTGVIFVHLNHTDDLGITLQVNDRLGLAHKLNLDSLQFVLQKRAIPTDVYLLSLREKGKTTQAKKALREMLAFTKRRAELGYSDKDPHLIRNFGFLDDQAIEIDVGGFHKDPKKDFHYYQTFELSRIQNKLLPWLEENYPEIAPYAKEEIVNIGSHSPGE